MLKIVVLCSLSLILCLGMFLSSYSQIKDVPQQSDFQPSLMSSMLGQIDGCPPDNTFPSCFSSIRIDGPTLRGNASTQMFGLAPTTPVQICSTSASMTGPGVSESGSHSAECFTLNTFVSLASTTFQPNSTYCINATHVGFGGGGSTTACLISPGPKVISVTYEQIAMDDLLIDVNPNTGAGLRIFPDKKIPAETVDRRTIRVRAQYSEAMAGVRIYFRNFDVDDPSADTAPLDTNDTPTVKTGNDNNGNVDGTTATRAGVLVVPAVGQPNPYNCLAFSNANASGVSCQTDANGVAKVNYTLTMQPGDNFSVVASPDENYVSTLIPAADGINLKDTNNLETPVTTTQINGCEFADQRSCRTDMLTVWRRIHLEVDSMGNVGPDNKVEGTITQTGIAQGNCPNPGPTPTPTPTPGPGPTPTPCTPDATGFLVTPDAGQQLDDGRFTNGRIVVGKRYFFVRDNNTTNVILRSVDGVAAKTSPGKRFALYDDDDYDADDNLVDGDLNEPITRLPDVFKYLSAQEGSNPDGTPRINVYSKAYVRPEYAWAENANYNQTNLGFALNLENQGTTNDPLSLALTNNRNSSGDERDEFWVGYFLLAYQGSDRDDGDGGVTDPQTSQFVPDRAVPGITKGPLSTEPPPCDCYQSTTCPVSNQGSVCQQFPKGGFGSALYQEIQQDVRRSWLRVNRTFQNIEITAPHELGHQFGFLGDQLRPTLMLMDYSLFTRDPSTTVINDIGLHAEHINIVRRRLKSPGQ